MLIAEKGQSKDVWPRDPRVLSKTRQWPFYSKDRERAKDKVRDKAVTWKVRHGDCSTSLVVLCDRNRKPA